MPPKSEYVAVKTEEGSTSAPRTPPKVSGVKGKSYGGKVGPRGRTQMSHSAKAGLMVSFIVILVASLKAMI